MAMDPDEAQRRREECERKARRGRWTPTGVHLPAADRCHSAAQASAHGLHIRRGYGSFRFPSSN